MTLRQAAAELAPTGTLRAGIGMGNALLVRGIDAQGDPIGVSPGLARAVADRLGVAVAFVTYPRPSDVADAVGAGAWDIALIGSDPARAGRIAFTPAYAEIEATYLAPPGSPLRTPADVDQPGVRIAVAAKAAYDLWLIRNIRHAELVHADSLEGARTLFLEGKLDALAGLRAFLKADAAALPGSRLLETNFMTVQQAIGAPRDRPAGAAFLASFVEEAKASGLVADLIRRFDVDGLAVAGPAPAP